MRVLIADDSPEVCNRLVKLMSGLKDVSIVAQVHSVPEAIASTFDTEPELILLDVRMPGGGSGLDVLHAAKGLPFPPIVVILTNYSQPSIRKRYLSEGADFFLDKATEFSKVASVLSKLDNSSMYHFPT